MNRPLGVTTQIALGHAVLAEFHLDLATGRHRDENRPEIEARDESILGVVEVLDIERTLIGIIRLGGLTLGSLTAGAGKSDKAGTRRTDILDRIAGLRLRLVGRLLVLRLPNAITNSHVRRRNRGHRRHGMRQPVQPRQRSHLDQLATPTRWTSNWAMRSPR